MLQVVDLGDQRPEDGLEWCHLVGSERCRVLVAGGDGTVDWVLNAIENLQLQVRLTCAGLIPSTPSSRCRLICNPLGVMSE